MCMWMPRARMAAHLVNYPLDRPIHLLSCSARYALTHPTGRVGDLAIKNRIGRRSITTVGGIMPDRVLGSRHRWPGAPDVQENTIPGLLRAVLHVCSARRE